MQRMTGHGHVTVQSIAKFEVFTYYIQQQSEAARDQRATWRMSCQSWELLHSHDNLLPISLQEAVKLCRPSVIFTDKLRRIADTVACRHAPVDCSDFSPTTCKHVDMTRAWWTTYWKWLSTKLSVLSARWPPSRRLWTLCRPPCQVVLNIIYIFISPSGSTSKQ